MMEFDAKKLGLGLRALAVFRALRQDPVVQSLEAYLSSLQTGSDWEAVECYA